jgi:hypothetical protein
VKLSNEALWELLRKRAIILDSRTEDVILVGVGTAAIRFPREPYAGAVGKVGDLEADFELISFSVDKN